MNDGSILAVLVVLVLLSAFFSASETAFSSLNRVRLRLRAEAGEKNAGLAMTLTEHYDDLLSSILIGNNIVNIAAASLATVLFTRHWGTGGPALSTVVLTLVILVFGEVSPKSLAKQSPEKTAILVSPAIRAVVWLFAPLNWLFARWKHLLQRLFGTGSGDSITEDELSGFVDEAHEDGVLNEQESELIHSALEFDDVEVDSILTPRVDLECVSDEADIEELKQKFEDTDYSRILVYHGTVDNIVGMVLEKDFYPAYIAGTAKLEDLIAPVEYTTEKTKISRLLKQLQSRKNHMAVVVDEYGGTAGVVTMEDILEELVGEIWDEHDDVVSVCRRQSDGTWLVDAGISIDDFEEQFGVNLNTDATTVGGWILARAGRIPREGYGFDFEDLRVDVVKVSNRRIVQARVRKHTLPEGEEKEAPARNGAPDDNR